MVVPLLLVPVLREPTTPKHRATMSSASSGRWLRRGSSRRLPLPLRAAAAAAAGTTRRRRRRPRPLQRPRLLLLPPRPTTTTTAMPLIPLRHHCNESVRARDRSDVAAPDRMYNDNDVDGTTRRPAALAALASAPIPHSGADQRHHGDDRCGRERRCRRGGAPRPGCVCTKDGPHWCRDPTPQRFAARRS